MRTPERSRASGERAYFDNLRPIQRSGPIKTVQGSVARGHRIPTKSTIALRGHGGGAPDHNGRQVARRKLARSKARLVPGGVPCLALGFRRFRWGVRGVGGPTPAPPPRKRHCAGGASGAYSIVRVSCRYFVSRGSKCRSPLLINLGQRGMERTYPFSQMSRAPRRVGTGWRSRPVKRRQEHRRRSRSGGSRSATLLVAESPCDAS